MVCEFSVGHDHMLALVSTVQCSLMSNLPQLSFTSQLSIRQNGWAHHQRAKGPSGARVNARVAGQRLGASKAVLAQNKLFSGWPEQGSLLNRPSGRCVRLPAL